MSDLELWKQPRSFLQFLRQILVAQWRSLSPLADAPLEETLLTSEEVEASHE